jgi:hypothetical protein
MTIPEYYDKCGSINATSRKFGILHTKVRKILISQGVDIGDKLAASIVDLKKQGYSQKEICKELEISDKVYNAHSEYTKGEYNLALDKLSRNARNLRRFRAKKKRLEMKGCMNNG